MTDRDGGAGYWYKVTYINSDTEAETDVSQVVRGGDHGHYAFPSHTREQAGS